MKFPEYAYIQQNSNLQGKEKKNVTKAKKTLISEPVMSGLREVIQCQGVYNTFKIWFW